MFSILLLVSGEPKTMKKNLTHDEQLGFELAQSTVIFVISKLGKQFRGE